MTVCYKCQGNWQTSPRHICIYDHRTRGSTWVKHCYGLVPLRRSSVATDAADILEQGIGSSSPAEDGRALIEHIIKCMYNLYGPSWGPVTTFGYVITDSRIYPPPPPSRRPTVGRASPNQNVAGYLYSVLSTVLRGTGAERCRL